MEAFSLGANYWSRAGGPRMWTQFDRDSVRTELEWAQRIGLDTFGWLTFARKERYVLWRSLP